MNVEEAKRRFRGSMVSVATPLNEDQSIDLGLLRENIRFMIEGGYKTGHGVLLVAAAGGEFPMLTMEERMQVIKASVEAAGGQVPVAASIQFNSSAETVKLARHCLEVGADLGQLSAPYYYGATDEDIFRHFSAASQVGLPIMVYNNWWNTVNMNTAMVLRLLELPNVVAVKWSAPNTYQYTDGLALFSNRTAVIDNEGMHVWSHMMGAVGCITHIGNFWPAYAVGLWDTLETRQYDAVIAKLTQFKWKWHGWVTKVVKETEGEGPFVKAAMQEVGLRVGPPRLPAAPVSPALRAELKALFAEVGVPKV
jgi:dihydrodipicolinate synthase/N-acetylneuraminate lyase